MKNSNAWRLSLLLWISLVFGISGVAQEQTLNEICSAEQLQAALSSSHLRSDEVKELNITPEGILVDRLVAVNAGKFLMKGGPLVRAEGYQGSLLQIKEGGSIEITNTLDGASIWANNAMVWIEKGGSMTLRGTLQNAINGDHAVAIVNSGTFYLNGGIISNNKDELGHIIVNFGEAYLIEGKIINNECMGSVYAEGTTILSPRGVELSGSDLNMFVSKPIGITDKLSYTLTLENVMEEGETLLYGTGTTAPYLLTKSDLQNVIIKNENNPNLVGALQNNQIILAKPAGSGVISTPEELQEAIDGATGTADNPTVITIAESGITLTEAIVVNTQHVVLTGGSITFGEKPHGGSMFRILEGTLTLENITIDGGCRTADQSCWGFGIDKGTLYMNSGVILTGFGLVGDVSVIYIYGGGSFIMNGGAITNNFFHSSNLSMASIVYVGQGNFTMNGGEISHNTGDYQLITITSYTSVSTFNHWGGVITNNGNGYIANYGGILTIGGKGSIQQDFVIHDGSVIRLITSLNYQLNVRFTEGAKISDGFVLAMGYNYILTEKDLSNIVLPEGYKAELSDNKIIIRIGSSGITTPEDLQKAINEAPEGSIDNPTVITLSGDISLSSTIYIIGKHIKIVGGKVIKIASIATTHSIRMFEITQNGSLTLEEITLDGNWGGYTSFAKVDETSSLLLLDKTILQNAKGNSDWLVLEIYGYLKMNQCYFQKNTGTPVAYLGAKSTWDCYGAKIYENVATQGNYVYSVFMAMGRSTVEQYDFYKNQGIALLCSGTVNMKRGSWENNTIDFGLTEKGTITVEDGITPHTVYYLNMPSDNYFVVKSKLSNDISLQISNAEEGFILAKGSGYTLTETDLKHFILSESLAKEWTVKLENNSILLTKNASSVIDTQEKLQAAIDASNGTAANPTTITIADKVISIYRSILIKNKYVTLTGGTLKNAASADLRMFDISSGFLGLTNIVLDGNKAKSTGYCTLIDMNGGSCKIMDGTQLKNAYARGGSDAVVTVAHGKLTVAGGEICDNTSNGGDIVWVSGDGYFEMQGGSIQRNKNTGRYIMAGIHIADGTMNLNGGHVVDNSGSRYGIYATKSFTMGGNANIAEPIILSGDSKILISSALKRTVTIGYLKSNMPSGTIVASGSGNYKLTEADVKKFTYRFANTYGFKLDGNNIVLSNLSAVNKTFKVTVNQPKNGSIKVDKTTAKENELVTVTVMPDKNYRLYYLRYNTLSSKGITLHSLSATKTPNVYTFKMPPSDASVDGVFTNINVRPIPPIKPTPINPTPIQPDSVIPDLPGLIDALGGEDSDNGGTIELTPDSKTPDNPDEQPINDSVEDGKNKGDDYIDSIEELIGYVSKDANGNTIKSEILYQLPCKIGLRFFLPDRLIVSEQLRASGTASYYILNQCADKITKIVPNYNPEDNSLTFETDKLGIFVVMNSNSSTANEVCVDDTIRLYTANGNIVIKGLEPGQSYQIYDISGRMLKNGIADINTVYFRPQAEGNYVVRCGGNAQIIHFEK